MPLRPMLAGKAPDDLDKLRFPLLASTKLDGIRCLIKDGVALSRTLKPIRNKHVQRLFGLPEYEGFDGELIVGSPTAQNCMQATSSGVMSADGEPDVKLYVFDFWNRGTQPFNLVPWALASLNNIPTDVICLDQYQIHTVSQLEDTEAAVLSAGYEGLILRDPTAPYKFNRATTREQWMLKLKRYEQSEALIVDYEQLMYNENELTQDELGYAKRSTAKDGKYPSDKLGALVCELPNGVTFSLGTGFDDLQRKLLWKQRAFLPGRVVTFKHFAQQGVLARPRHPVFVSFRDPDDM